MYTLHCFTVKKSCEHLHLENMIIMILIQFFILKQLWFTFCSDQALCKPNKWSVQSSTIILFNNNTIIKRFYIKERMLDSFAKRSCLTQSIQIFRSLRLIKITSNRGVYIVHHLLLLMPTWRWKSRTLCIVNVLI